MKDILFKTKPRLFLFGVLVSGFFFFLIMALFCLQVSNGKHQIISYCFAGIFALFSIIILYQLFKIRILKISRNGITVKKYLLPQKTNLKFEEIKTIKQTEIDKTLLFVAGEYAGSYTSRLAWSLIYWVTGSVRKSIKTMFS